MDINPLDAQTQFTIQVLFKPEADGPGQQQFLHLDDENAGRVLMETRLGTDNRWYLHSFASTSGGRAQLATAGALHRADEWHWAALTYTNGTIRHYVDGQQEASAELKFDPMKSGKMSIGSRLNQENWFKGCIRALRFANAALPAHLLERDVSVTPSAQLRAQAGG